MEGLIFKNKKGFYTYVDNEFAIIDKRYLDKIKENEKWKFEVIKTITDKKGNKIKILKPVEKVYKVLIEKYDEKPIKVYCGEHLEKEYTLEEALNLNLVWITKREIDKRPFLEGTKSIYIKTKDDKDIFYETIPLSTEEKEKIERDYERVKKYLQNFKGFVKDYECYKSLKEEYKKVKRELENLESELENLKNKAIKVIKYPYVFYLDDNNQILAFEKKYVEVTEEIIKENPFNPFDWEHTGRYVTYQKEIEEEISLSKFEKEYLEKIYKELLEKKKEKEENIKTLEEKIEKLKNILKTLEKEIESIDKRKARLGMLYLDYNNKTNIYELDAISFKDYKTLDDEEIISNLPFEIESPFGFMAVLRILKAVPKDFKKEIEDYGVDEVGDFIILFINYFNEKFFPKLNSNKEKKVNYERKRIL